MKKKHVLGAAIALAVCMMATGVPTEAKKYNLSNGDRYAGTMTDEKKEGPGTLFYEDGGRLNGIWYHDEIEGPVMIAYEDGSCFKGTYRKGVREGLGVMIDEDGEIEPGLWKNGKKAGSLHKLTISSEKGNTYYVEATEDIHGGQGIVVYANGDIYIGGLVKDNRREDKGTLYYSDGRWITTTWKDDQIEGEATIFEKLPEDEDFPTPYRRCFMEDGQRIGISVYYASDGGRVISDSTDGKNDGLGVIILADGRMQASEWKNGKERSTPEVWEDSHKDHYVGTKEGGVIDGYGVCMSEDDGFVYIGEFENGEMEGDGFFYWLETDTWYEGEFEEGERTGEGVLCRPSEFYIGSFEKGKLNGKAVCYDMDGSWTEGTWKDHAPDFAIETEVDEDGSTDVIVYENGKKKKGDVGVTMYKEPGYSGVSAVFVPGEYHVADMMKRGIFIKSISSIRVPDGYCVKVFTEDDECKGNSTMIRGDSDSSSDKYFSDKLDDLICSFIVEKDD